MNYASIIQLIHLSKPAKYETSLLRTGMLLFDHFGCQFHIIRKDQFRHLGEILINLLKLRLNFLPRNQRQSPLNLIKVADLLVRFYLPENNQPSQEE